MPDEENRIRRKYWREIFAALAVIILFTVLFVHGDEDAIEFQFEDTQMSIIGPDEAPEAVTLDYSEILSVNMRDDLNPGSFKIGLDTDTCKFGTWQNEEMGSFTLCAFPNVSEYIVLETTNGTVVFNYQDNDSTEHLYTAFLELLESKGWEADINAG